MIYFLLGLVLFLGVHSVSIVAPGWRDARAAAMGEGAWKGVYSLVSIIGFVLLIYGYGLARHEPVVLYTPPAALRHVAMLLMLPVFPLLLAAYLPGWLKRTAKHPMLLAVKLWALAHLLVNGNLADVLLFGGFLLWAAADRVSMKNRVQRPLPGPRESPVNDAIAVVAGLAIYALFVVWAHGALIGIPLM